jgi:prenyltransferase beta subunit
LSSYKPIDSRRLEASLQRGRRWIEECHLENESGACGWAHFRGEAEPSVWGGTLDGIRALLYLGAPPLSHELSSALQWMKLQQRLDGGFGSRELQYSACEATSWVVITYAQLGLTADNDDSAKRAVDYIQQCVDARGGVSTTPLDSKDPRTFPATLALWALSKQSSTATICSSIVERLRTSQDPESGGWGVKFGAPPNAVSTAQVLHAARQSGIAKDSQWLVEGKEYLISRQEDDGGWRNSHDEWFTEAVPKTPYRTSHFATSWALLALSLFQDREARMSGTRAARKLMESQQETGAWLYEEFDPTEHVWCTTQAVIALIAWRDGEHSRVAPHDSRIGQLDSYGKAGVDLLSALARGWRSWLLYLVVAFLVLVQFAHGIVDATVSLLRLLRLDGSSVWNNVVSSAIWAVVLLVGAVAARRLTGRGKTKRSKSEKE